MSVHPPLCCVCSVCPDSEKNVGAQPFAPCASAGPSAMPTAPEGLRGKPFTCPCGPPCYRNRANSLGKALSKGSCQILEKNFMSAAQRQKNSDLYFWHQKAPFKSAAQRQEKIFGPFFGVSRVTTPPPLGSGLWMSQVTNPPLEFQEKL